MSEDSRVITCWQCLEQGTCHTSYYHSRQGPMTGGTVASQVYFMYLQHVQELAFLHAQFVFHCFAILS